MKPRSLILICLSATLAIGGCASTKITGRDELVSGPLPRPNTIWIYDFAATPANVPDNSAFAGQSIAYNTSQSPEQIAAGRKLGAEIAGQLVEQVLETGMFAERATAATKPRLDDIVIRGYLISYNEGDTADRMVIGFGEGKANLKVAVEGFQMTAKGLRKLGSGSTSSAGGDEPGMDLGAASLLATHNPAGLIISTGMNIYGQESGSNTIQGRVKDIVQEIAGVFRQRFEEEGWIS